MGTLAHGCFHGRGLFLLQMTIFHIWHFSSGQRLWISLMSRGHSSNRRNMTLWCRAATVRCVWRNIEPEMKYALLVCISFFFFPLRPSVLVCTTQSSMLMLHSLFCRPNLDIACINNLHMSHTEICRHTFHSHCLQLWISKSPTCPYCRQDLSVWRYLPGKKEFVRYGMLCVILFLEICWGTCYIMR